MKSVLSYALGLVMTIVILLLAVLLSSCSEDDDDPFLPVAERSSLPFPDTPDQLMDNFLASYGGQDLAGYAATLHPDYTFVLTDGREWGRDQELRIAGRMFCGEDHVKDGRTVAGVARIEFLRFEALGDWLAKPSGEWEVRSRAYAVGLRFHRTDGTFIEVHGRNVFEVIRDEAPTGDVTGRAGWLILRQIDATG